MGKPIVRFVVDKDALQKLIPEGDIEAQLSLDNAFVQLIQETGKRLLTESFLEAFYKQFDSAVKHELYTGWGNSKEEIQKLIGDKVKQAINLYAQEKVQEVVDSLNDELVMEARRRMDVAKKLIDQHTTPEGIEALMVKACAALVKGQIK
jgi:membrane peptidoglycan carboxypeptidase